MNNLKTKISIKCWEFMNCPDNIKKNCWAYRLNMSRECWILRKKAKKDFKWMNDKDCEDCKFYNLFYNYKTNYKIFL